MPRLNFVVYGPPVPKGRPRIARTKSGGSFAYTPPKTKAYEKLVATQALAHVREWPTDSRYFVRLSFYLKNNAGRPDVDNLAKGVLDALNKICWDDDSQIFELRVLKHVPSANPFVDVTVETIDDVPEA